MITYIENIKVFLDKKHVGNIKTLAGGYAYFPKGSKTHGQIYQSVEKVKCSLEFFNTMIN